MASLLIDVLYGQGSISINGNRFHRAGYILRCVSTQPALGSIPGNGNPIQVGAGATPTPDDETKIPRLPNVIVGSESIRADLSPEAWLQIQLDKLLGFDMYVASFTPLEGGRPKGASPKLGAGNRPHTTGWQPPYIVASREGFKMCKRSKLKRGSGHNKRFWWEQEKLVNLNDEEEEEKDDFGE